MAKAQISIVAGNIGWLEWMTGIQRQAGGIPFLWNKGKGLELPVRTAHTKAFANEAQCITPGSRGNTSHLRNEICHQICLGKH